MKRVMITGMSGTGKSAVIRAIVARGYRTYDLDTPEWSEWIDADPLDALTPTRGKDWVWRVDRVRALLSTPGDGILFIGGCAENMKQPSPLLYAAPEWTSAAYIDAQRTWLLQAPWMRSPRQAE